MDHSEQVVKSSQDIIKPRKLITREGWLILIPPVLFSVFILGLLYTEDVRLLVLENGNWHAMDRLPGAVQSFEVSDGILWAYTSRSHGLSSFSGNAWTHFPLTEFSSSADYIESFSANGKQTWVATEEAIHHYNGQTWVKYPGVLPDKHGIDIFAEGNDVWAVGRAHILAHYDGSAWTSIDLNIIPQVNEDPKLFRTKDGSLWLRSGGIWRFNELQWTKVIPEDALQSASFLGVAHERLWLKEELVPIDRIWGDDEERLAWISLDGSSYEVLTRDKLPISLQGGETQFLIAPNERLLIKVQDMLIPYGSKIQQPSATIPPPPSEFLGIKELKTYGNHNFIGIAERDQGILSAMRKHLVHISIGFLVAWLIVATWAERTGRKKRTLEAKSIHSRFKELSHGGKHVPEIDKVEANEGIDTKGLVTRLNSYVSHFLLEVAILIVIGVPLGLLFGQVNSTWLMIFLGFLFICGLLLLVTWLTIHQSKLIFASLESGDYDTAVRLASKKASERPLSEAEQLHGSILMYAGRFNEAEQVIKAYIADKSHEKERILLLSSHIASLMAVYGRVLLWSGQYESAISQLNKGLELREKCYELQLCLAEVYLSRGERLQEALSLIDLGIKIKKRSVLERIYLPHYLLRLYGARAWAQSLLSDYEAAKKSISKGLNIANRSIAPELALFYFRAGQVHELGKNLNKAIKYYSEAAETDPHGYMGAQAKQMFVKHSGKM